MRDKVDSRPVDARPAWQTERWPDELTYLPRRNRVFVLSGPAGAGKDELLKRLLGRMPDLKKTTSWTSKARPIGHPREDREYHYVTEPDFLQLIREGKLLEWTRYPINDGDYYGTPISEVQAASDSGLDVLLKIEVDGALKVKSRIPGAVLIFLTAESLAQLRARMEKRGRESEDRMTQRLARAENELARAGLYDYVVINRDGEANLELAVEQVIKIIEVERLRARYYPVDLG